MSNCRVYPEEDYVSKLKNKYCPKCLSNNLSYFEGVFNIIYGLHCVECKFTGNESHFLEVSKIRDMKISQILD